MKSKEFYDHWRNEGKKAETVDQTFYILLNEITKRGLLEQVPQDICDHEMERIWSLRESLEEFVQHEYERSFESFKCEEFTSEFLEAYRKFLSAGEPGVEYSPSVAHFTTIGNILYLSKENGMADWTPEVNSYEGFSLILS